MKLLVLLTKADKLNRREAHRALADAQHALAPLATETSDIGVSLFSALERLGVGDVAMTLKQWVHR